MLSIVDICFVHFHSTLPSSSGCQYPDILGSQSSQQLNLCSLNALATSLALEMGRVPNGAN